MSRQAVPLPADLDGTVNTRAVEIDSALFFIVGGALTDLLTIQVQETGTLTESEFRAAILEMLRTFYQWVD